MEYRIHNIFNSPSKVKLNVEEGMGALIPFISFSHFQNEDSLINDLPKKDTTAEKLGGAFVKSSPEKINSPFNHQELEHKALDQSHDGNAIYSPRRATGTQRDKPYDAHKHISSKENLHCCSSISAAVHAICVYCL